MLTLTILRCPDATSPETRTVSGGEYSIGRGPDNDWVLPDPDRHLSKSHCMLRFRAGAWELLDLSANGTFLNGETAPVGPSAPRGINTGDRLTFGRYEIEVAIAAAALPSHTAQRRGSSPATADPLRDDPFTSDPLAPRPAPASDLLPLPEEDFIGSKKSIAPNFEDSGFEGLVQHDHSPAIDAAFRPPPQRIAAILDDWDADAPAVAAPSQAGASEIPPTADPAPPAAPPMGPSQAAAADAVLLDAFLRGVGLPDARLTDAARTLEGVGAALRAMVAGLRSALIARASIKSEFRIEQTQVRPSGNNPLKFSAGDDDALAALLGAGRYNGMAPADAVEDSLRDMRLHELASVAAMQHAVRELLAEFEPSRVGRQAEGSRLQIRRKALAWDAFEAMHARVTQALSDDFDSVFGKAFARAYEQALREVEAQEQRDVRDL